MNFLFLLALPFLAHASATAPSPACNNFKTPLTYEQGLWILGPLRLTAKDGKDGSILPLDQKIIYTLEPASTQKYVAAPEKKPKEGTFGAMVPIRVANSGKYRISVGQKAWIDVVTVKGERVASAAHEMQMDCDKIRKVVTFPLDGGKDYVLQLSGSEKTELEVLLTKESK